MKPDIHPEYVRDHRDVLVWQPVHDPQHCQERHHPRGRVQQVPPFTTGKQKILDTGGRVAKFEKRFGKSTPSRCSSGLLSS